MTVALPAGDEQAALAEVLGDLGHDQGRAPVQLSMPRWTFRADSALTAPLKALGMTVAFDPDRADFSAMTTDASLYVADALHQTFVAVDEQGTEAAAATAVVMGDTSAAGRSGDRGPRPAVPLRDPRHRPRHAPLRGPGRRPPLTWRARITLVRRRPAWSAWSTRAPGVPRSTPFPVAS